MKNYSHLAVYSIFLLAFSWLTACAPQIATRQDAPPSGLSFDEEKILHMLRNPVILRQFDLRTEVTGRTPTFSQEEVQQAKDITLARLKEEGIDKFAPSLRLLDDQNDAKRIAIFVGLADDRELENGELLGRTYHIQHGKLIRVIKRYPDGSSMMFRTAFTDEEIESAVTVISEYLRSKHGWKDSEFDVAPRIRTAIPPKESHILEFDAIHKNDLNQVSPRTGGKSLLVRMNMNTGEIAQVLHSQ